MLGIVATDFHKVAGTPTAIVAGGRAGPMQVQSADEVAEQVVSLIEHPIAELYTNLSSADLVQQYYRDVGPLRRTWREGPPQAEPLGFEIFQFLMWTAACWSHVRGGFASPKPGSGRYTQTQIRD